MINNLRLINMRDVAVEEVRWLWYPYIPLGKLTIIQGDPGEGKQLRYFLRGIPCAGAIQRERFSKPNQKNQWSAASATSSNLYYDFLQRD